MGIAVSLILIAVGAILTWGVSAEAEGLDVNSVGVILMIVGLIGLLLSLLFWRSWWGPGYFHRATYVQGDPAARPWYYGPWGRRRTTYEEEEGPPGPPPP